MDVDVKGNRLFVAGLENGSVEVRGISDGEVGEDHPRVSKAAGYRVTWNLSTKCSWPAATTECSASSAATLSDWLIPSVGSGSQPCGLRSRREAGLMWATRQGRGQGLRRGWDHRRQSGQAHWRYQSGRPPWELLLDQSGKTLFVFVSALAKFKSWIQTSARWCPRGDEQPAEW